MSVDVTNGLRTIANVESTEAAMEQMSTRYKPPSWMLGVSPDDADAAVETLRVRPKRKPPVGIGDLVQEELLTTPDRFIQGLLLGVVIAMGCFAFGMFCIDAEGIWG